jgi:uncharacterized protein (TIGR01777 family)
MKILISGGTGLIGQALTRYFLNAGHEVVILTRGEKRGDPNENLHYAQWDAKSTAPLLPLITDIDVVINLAGENIGSGSWTKERKLRIVESRIQAGNALAEAVVAAPKKPEVFIQASGVGFYGTSESLTFDEKSPNGDDFLGDVAEKWENSSVLVEDAGVRRVIIRTGVVLEKSSGVLPLMMLPFKLFVGGPLGSGRQIISWIHLQDEVRAIDFCINNQNISGPINLTSPNAVSNSEFGKMIGKVIRRPFWFPTPAFLLKIVLGEQSVLVLEGQRAFPQKLLDHGFNFLYPNLFDALQNIINDKK